MVMTSSDGALEELSAHELLETGCSIYEGGDPDQALVYLRDAYCRDSRGARVRSYYGLCLGLSERRFEESGELCQSAARQEFFNPEHYLNLARLYLGFGFKAEGVRFLRRGLMIDPGHAAIHGILNDLGGRVSPVLGFLPRRHAINRWLGVARHLIVRRRGIGITA